ncbi:hypothetical protein C8Q78DRAFT_339417 [Trametes maxima]|nr:hypothetical protein C8Q78DRAFT_339417 [Trametes maxima]
MLRGCYAAGLPPRLCGLADPANPVNYTIWIILRQIFRNLLVVNNADIVQKPSYFTDLHQKRRVSSDLTQSPPCKIPQDPKLPSQTTGYLSHPSGHSRQGKSAPVDRSSLMVQ